LDGDVDRDSVAPSGRSAETRTSCSVQRIVVSPDGWSGKQLAATDRGLERRRVGLSKLSPRVGDCRLVQAADDAVTRNTTSVVDGDVCDRR